MHRLLLLLLLLGGCAPTYWHREPSGSWHLDAVQIVDASPRGYCDQYPDAIACAVRDPITSSCTIYLPRGTPARDCVLVHELTHCAGWDHPGASFTYTTCPR